MALAFFIPFCLMRVNFSINFYNETRRVAIKIYNILADDLLATKVQPLQSIRPQTLPQNLFSSVIRRRRFRAVSNMTELTL